jgi:hypothetical protein
VETRLAEIKQLSTELDKHLASIASREQIVIAVKAEVENVHQISARTKADLAHVTEHRGEVTALKGRVDELLSRIAETDQRIVAIDGRRKLVDEVQTKANAIVHLLDDVRTNLEALGERRRWWIRRRRPRSSVHLGARQTLRAAHERELAERIEQGIKQLRATGKSNEEKRSA